MASYRLSEIAKSDLIDIARWGDENHGVARSNKYRDDLKRHFTHIAQHPLSFPAVDHIRKGYRRSVIGVHSIYYLIDGDIVKIMAVIRAQSIQKHMQDNDKLGLDG